MDWWQKDAKEAFIEKAKCIIHQYGNYTEPIVNEKLNGINTQGENIGEFSKVKFLLKYKTKKNLYYFFC